MPLGAVRVFPDAERSKGRDHRGIETSSEPVAPGPSADLSGQGRTTTAPWAQAGVPWRHWWCSMQRWVSAAGGSETLHAGTSPGGEEPADEHEPPGPWMRAGQ